MAIANRRGRYAGEYDRHFSLPVIADESFFMDKNRNIGLLSSMGLSYRFGSGITLSSVSGISYEGASRDVYVPSDVLNGNIYASSVAFKRQLITVNTTLNYLRDFSEALQLDMTLGNEIRSADDRLTSVNGERSMENGGSNYVKIVTGYNASQTNALSDHVREKLVGFYGIWKWKYKKDLGVNMVLRADGSSLYNDKWSLYPALGIHYDLKNRLKLPVKVNASIGKTGVAARPAIYQGSLDAYGEYYGGNYLGVGELYPAFDGARSVGVTQIDAGFAVQFSPNIVLAVDYFNKTYRHFTYQRFLPNISGIDYSYETGGAVRLAGIEVNLEAKWIRTNRFSWTSNLNFASYRNKIKELPAQIENTSLAFLGTLSAGDALTSQIAYSGKQAKIIGNSEPTAFGGITNTFRYGNISAAMVFTYAWGADVVAESFSSRYYADRVDHTFPVKDAETPYYLIEAGDNGRTLYQGIRTVEDAGFLRLSRASLTYHLSSVAKQLAQFSDLEIFVRANNLLTLSRYSGINPEENITGTRRYDLRHTGTPLPSSVALGLKIVF